jgi:hypothetical protein
MTCCPPIAELDSCRRSRAYLGAPRISDSFPFRLTQTRDARALCGKLSPVALLDGAVLSAAIFARPQSDRTGLRKAQKTVGKSRGAHPRRRLAANRYTARMLLPDRMRKLLPCRSIKGRARERREIKPVKRSSQVGLASRTDLMWNPGLANHRR